MNARVEEMCAALENSPVFTGIAAEGIPALVEELGAYTKSYSKGDIICHMGGEMTSLPIIISGTVEARIPRDGRNQIVSRFTKGDSFAEAVPLSLKRAPVEVGAVTDVRLLLVPAKRLELAFSADALKFRSNITSEMALKISELSSKLAMLAEPRLRNRLLMYLESFDTDRKGYINLPYSRKELAEYLGVNDKALLREMRRMQDEGIIEADGRCIRVFDYSALNR